MATKVTTYEGIDITLNERGKFQAIVNGRIEIAASLTSLQQKIKAFNIGEVRGNGKRVEGLEDLPSGSLHSGFHQQPVSPIIGVTSEKEGRGPRARVTAVYICENRDRFRGAGSTTRYAHTLVRPNPAAMEKLTALHKTYVAFVAKLEQEVDQIIAEEFEHVTIDDIKQLLRS